MARVFLDANIFLDIFGRRKYELSSKLDNNVACMSTLSLHILFYVMKYKIPQPGISGLFESVGIVPMDIDIVEKSLVGPTQDFEDNVHLHSGVKADCDIFLTNDKKLLSFGYFGKMKILADLD